MFEWTGVNTQILRDLWGEHSSSYIAGIIGAPSRNSVLGKAHRLGLSEKRSGTPKTRATPFRNPRVQRLHDIPPPRIEPQTSEELQLFADAMSVISVHRDDNACSLMELTSETCRWPLWKDVVSDQYCGAKPVDGSSYCPVHSKKAWRR
jgi:GcrA cell cycle regulator